MQPASNNHIVQKQHIEINFDQLEDAMGIQHELADVYYEKLQPAMLALFDQLADEKHVITIDRLEIDCGKLNSKNWKEEWVSATICNLKEQLATADKKEINQLEEESDGLLFFLATGLRSWNNRAISVAEMENNVEPAAAWMTKLKKLLHDEPRAADRLASAFSASFVNKILQELINQYKLHTGGDEITRLLFQYQQGTNVNAGSLSVLLKAFSEPTVERVKEKLASTESILKNEPLPEQEKDDPGARKKAGQPATDIFISNAGLVLVHPFLPVLFQRLGLWQGKQWKNEMAQYKAVQLLEFLATGAEAATEFNLPLNKILCGMAVDEVWEIPEPMSEMEKDACAALLDEVVNDWPKLKNTSRAALREIFLQRNGRLDITGGLWKLKVEQKAYDILLSSLPWGIGVIKLPWMQNMLYTEWNN